MPRLGTVVGGILAELARARATADTVTRDLYDEYKEDPVLANLSVPRVTLGEVSVSLRFAVEDVEEPNVTLPDPGLMLDDWERRYSTVVTDWLRSDSKLGKREQLAVAHHLGGVPVDNDEALLRKPPRRMVLSLRSVDANAALKGDPSAMITVSARVLVDRFSRLPQATRAQLGNKQAFQKALTVVTKRDLEKFVDRKLSIENVKTHLNSKVQVSVLKSDISADPTQNQEIQLTLRGSDLDVILALPEETEE